jgi:hypothetical protein
LFFDKGFNLGNDDKPYTDQPALNNHYEIVLRSVLPPSIGNFLTNSPQVTTRLLQINTAW